MSNINVLYSKPMKNEDEKIVTKYEDENIVIIYPKEFSKLEKWIHNRIGGPKMVRRPLDRYTTFIWEKIDGSNSVKDIINEFDAEFGEVIAPASQRVQKFLEKLLDLRLITLE